VKDSNCIIDGLVGLDDNILLTKPALASVLRVSGRTAQRMIGRGEIPAPIVQGHRRLWKVSSIRRWFDRLDEEAQRHHARQRAERERIEARMAVL